MFISEKKLNEILTRLSFLDDRRITNERKIANLKEELDHLKRIVGGPKIKYVYGNHVEKFDGPTLCDRMDALPYKFVVIDPVPAEVVAEPKKP